MSGYCFLMFLSFLSLINNSNKNYKLFSIRYLFYYYFFLRVIEERLNIITEIIHSDSVVFKRLSGIIYKLPDLERLLCLAFYHKVSMFYCYLILSSLKFLNYNYFWY